MRSEAPSERWGVVRESQVTPHLPRRAMGATKTLAAVLLALLAASSVAEGRASVRGNARLAAGISPSTFWADAALIAQKTKQPNLSRDQLSSMMQFLIDFAGTDTVIDAVVNWFTSLGTNWSTANLPQGMTAAVWKRRPVPTLIAQGNGVVHWIYYGPPKKGSKSASTPVVFNSYKIGHQKTGSHQFCQSFAQIYLICDRQTDLPTNGPAAAWAKANCERLQVAQKGDPEYWDRLGHNIRIVTGYWRMILGTVQKSGAANGLATWFADRFRSVNHDFVVHNQQNSRASSQYALMWPGTSMSDTQVFASVAEKLNIIDHFATQIAEKV